MLMKLTPVFSAVANSIMGLFWKRKSKMVFKLSSKNFRNSKCKAGAYGICNQILQADNELSFRKPAKIAFVSSVHAHSIVKVSNLD